MVGRWRGGQPDPAPLRGAPFREQNGEYSPTPISAAVTSSAMRAYPASGLTASVFQLFNYSYFDTHVGLSGGISLIQITKPIEGGVQRENACFFLPNS